ncbi:PREDICTED: pentatricopeptide repeat-containing protein At3g20730-like [Ipomoea nil]|uniref:pentatricopeptide repeat-containing protein At3g20730-like n=1 Tax=Ipomoea nil TaxID=35883 RepID=UPI000901C042|nr:PREDICTED: pentatricopeptide repeat-containing protein At3g20730-like [Ipomoea nil]XP_019153946.1 PREDICTED: pentatricopeptide repeat-containing protein At3g20730-like [Ipomoea nil]
MSSLASMKSAVESLCNAKRLREALALIFHNPTGADYSLYSKLLDLCIDLKAKSHGHLIHAHLIKNDFPSSIHLNNKLIIFYSKFGEMEVAHMVFNRMPERNLVSWTALVSGYSKNGDSGEALGVFSTMHREGLKGNQFTYGSALRACTNLLCLDRGRQVQARIQKSRFAGNLFVQSALLDFHSKCGKMEDARCVFDLMSERDFISWNAMIGGYSFQGFDDDAFLMFQLMLREGMHPDCFTFGSILRNSFGSCRVAGLTKVNIIHGFIIQLGYESNNILSGSLIDAYVKCGNLAGANCLYRDLKIKDTIACTALITGYAREGRSSDDWLELFTEIHRMHSGIDSVLLCSMLNMCANSTLLALGRQMHSLALKYQNNNDVALGNSLIDMYSKTGEIEDAKRTFDHMKEKNIISWTSMISAYGMHGRVEDAILLYKKMESQGIYPNDITFLSLFSACSHTGLTVEGWECFRNMVGKYKLLPRSEHYACMVDLLARGGCLEEAHNLICRGDIKPDASLWGSILGACSMYGNTSLGEVAAKHLFSMKPQESANYAVLANIYALGGLWQRASDVRELMVNRGLLKNPGYSFIQSKSNKIALAPTVQETDPSESSLRMSDPGALI